MCIDTSHSAAAWLFYMDIFKALLAALHLGAIPFKYIREGEGKPKNIRKMQLDVDMSPPANIMTFRLTVTHASFYLDSCDL